MHSKVVMLSGFEITDRTFEDAKAIENLLANISEIFTTKAS